MATISTACATNGQDGCYNSVSGTAFTTGGTRNDFGKNSSTPRGTFIVFDGWAGSLIKTATINSAYIQSEATLTRSGTTCNVLITGWDVDDPNAVIPTSAAEARAVTRTTASTAWNNVEAFTSGNLYDSADITTIVEEIRDRAGWDEDGMGFAIEDNSSSTNATRSIGIGGASTASTLNIDYTAAAAGGHDLLLLGCGA